MKGQTKRSPERSTKARRAGGAPKAKLAVAFAGALVLILAVGVTLASAVVPTVIVEDAKEVSYTSALAKGTVDPQGEETNCHFEYITQTQLDENVTNGLGEFEFAPQAECDGNPHTGSGAQAVEAPLAGLAPATVYHLRLVASNADGQSEAVAANTFETKAVAKPTVAIDPVTTFTGTTAHLSGTIEPKAPAGNPAAFDVSWEFQCVPSCPGISGGTIPADAAAHAVAVDAAGLEPNTHYEVTLVATNAGGTETAGPASFTTQETGPSAQTIPAFALEGGHSALLGGRVNPHNSATTYWFEYGTSTGYGTSVPASKDADAGAEGQEKVVTEEVTGLTPGTVYHYRLVTKNASGEVKGEDMTFKTGTAPQQPAPGSCPNEQFRFGPSAALPDCRAYELVNTNDLLGSSAIAPPEPASVLPWTSVAADGEAALWRTRGVVPGVDSGGVVDWYVSKRTPSGWADELVSPPGSKTAVGAPLAAWASPNLERVIFLTYGALVDPEDLDPVTPGNHTLLQDFYRHEPDGSLTRITRGSVAGPIPEEGGEVNDTYNLGGISNDGLKVAFAARRQLEPDAPNGGTYLRVGQTTTLIGKAEDGTPLTDSAPIGMSADGSTVAIFAHNDELLLYNKDLPHLVLVASGLRVELHAISMSPNGSRFLFAARAALTPDDTDHSFDIYEYDLNTRTLKRISAPTGAPAGPGPGNGPAEAEPAAVSPDGSTVYFTSTEQLDGTKGTSGEQNLYVYHAGVTSFVASLGSGGNEFRLVPDSAKLLFGSASRLTAYDNAGHTEVYVYDSESGVLACASCRPSGAPPTGDSSFGHGSEQEEFTSHAMGLAGSDDHGGRIFFHSADRILSRDENDAYDVYEYDAVSGTESLISTGKSEANSVYYGTGANGRDVFFFSAEGLAEGDAPHGPFKLYDARVGGGFPVSVKSAPCEGEGCRGSTSPVPAAAAPGTPNFIGPGNPQPKSKKHKHHKKHKAHKHKSHHKHQGKGHKRDGNRNGRTGR